MNRQDFLSQFNLQLDNRGRCQPASQNKPDSAWLTSLDHWGVLSISGPDTRKFLQGQLSCDINAITPDNAVFGALCTPKGRMISNFYLLQGDDCDTLLMLMPQECIALTQQTLSKYIVFSKAEMRIAEQYALIGLSSDKPSNLLGLKNLQRLQGQHLATGPALCVANNRYLLCVERHQLETSWQILTEQLTVQGGNIWELADIQAGLGFVFAATQEEFIPQMLNMQLIDGINFDKGCYTGQEIIARTQYRGKIKRHMRRFNGSISNLPTPGDELLNDAGKMLATVVSAEESTGQTSILAVVTANWDSGAVLSSSGDTLSEHALPYALPDDSNE